MIYEGKKFVVVEPAVAYDIGGNPLAAIHVLVFQKTGDVALA